MGVAPGVQGPAVRERRTGVLDGGDTGEFVLAAAGTLLVRADSPPSGVGVVVERCARCGWEEREAPCWVLREQP